MVQINIHGSHPWEDIALDNLISKINGTYGKIKRGSSSTKHHYTSIKRKYMLDEDIEDLLLESSSEG